MENGKIDKDVGLRIKSFRKEYLKLSQKEFAEAIGITQANVSQVESGLQKPSTDFWHALVAKYPIVNLNWLVSGVGQMIKSNVEIREQFFKEELYEQKYKGVKFYKEKDKIVLVELPYVENLEVSASFLDMFNDYPESFNTMFIPYIEGENYKDSVIIKVVGFSSGTTTYTNKCLIISNLSSI